MSAPFPGFAQTSPVTWWRLHPPWSSGHDLGVALTPPRLSTLRPGLGTLAGCACSVHLTLASAPQLVTQKLSRSPALRLQRLRDRPLSCRGCRAPHDLRPLPPRPPQLGALSGTRWAASRTGVCFSTGLPIHKSHPKSEKGAGGQPGIRGFGGRVLWVEGGANSDSVLLLSPGERVHGGRAIPGDRVPVITGKSQRVSLCPKRLHPNILGVSELHGDSPCWSPLTLSFFQYCGLSVTV